MNKKLALGLVLGLSTAVTVSGFNRVAPCLRSLAPAVRSISTTRMPAAKVVCESRLAIDQRANLNEQFVSSIRNGSILEAAMMIHCRKFKSLDFDVNAKSSKDGRTALELAIQKGDLFLVKSFIDNQNFKIDEKAFQGIIRIASTRLTDPVWNEVFHNLTMRK